MAYKSRLHNKAETSLYSWSAEARKSSAQVVRESFTYQLESNYWQASKVFWWAIKFFSGENIVLLNPSRAKWRHKQQWGWHLWQMKRVLQSSSELSHTHIIQLTRRSFVAENTNTATKYVFLANTLQAAGCDEIRFEILRTNRVFFG